MTERLAAFANAASIESFTGTNSWDSRNLFRRSYNAAPGAFVPVLREAKGFRRLSMMCWGMEENGLYVSSLEYEQVMKWDEGKRKMYHPCVILASGFYMFPTAKTLPDSSTLPHDEGTAPVFCAPNRQILCPIAAVYRSDVGGENEKEVDELVLLSMPSSKRLSVLGERIPACLLQPEDVDIWLEKGLTHSVFVEEGALWNDKLLQPLVWHRVTKKVLEPSFDDPICVKALEIEHHGVKDQNPSHKRDEAESGNAANDGKRQRVSEASLPEAVEN